MVPLQMELDMDAVRYEVADNVAILTVEHPPVNALSAAVRFLQTSIDVDPSDHELQYGCAGLPIIPSAR